MLKVKHVGVLIVNLAQVGPICIRGGVLLLEPATLLKVALSPSALFTFFKLCKWYQIAQSISISLGWVFLLLTPDT